MDEPWKVFARAVERQADVGGTMGSRGRMRVADVLVEAAERTIGALVARGWPWLAARALALRFLDGAVGWVVEGGSPEALEVRLRAEWETLRPRAPGQSEWAGSMMKVLEAHAEAPALIGA